MAKAFGNNAKMPKIKEGFKRPNHVDFKTTEEHKRNKTTGVRKNDMTMTYEFWILGEIVHRVDFKTVALDKDALAKAHLEVFKF